MKAAFSAGKNLKKFMPLEQVTEKQFHRMFDTNVLGMLLVTQEALKHFNADGESIINIGSGDIAPAAVFFASDDSKWITGEMLLIAGGLR